ncbi:tyrosine-type recombinase/integrase [Cytobacillus sp. S13-E01]|uniref:tyrosine-type recombinase/integrase n=1 Tax=Cytobacillus sp. S13-E01 TaxID=3031326 RepID=UPI0023D7E592|nr:tyrosine-type recombinase/integrase [Cytobacillus sp. S13-E01]MDF0728731.1 tyrosine-type recombinase/integrase [Cytobacillus sp. S13-E01]
MNDFADWLQNEGKQPNTVKRYKIVANEFTNWIEKKNKIPFNPTIITTKEVLEWVAFLSKNNKESTIKNKVICIRSYLKYLNEVEGRELRIDEIYFTSDTKVNTLHFLNEKDKSLLLKFINDKSSFQKNHWLFYRNKAIITIMLYGGLRASEVINLRVSDINKGSIRVRENYGIKERSVSVNQEMKQHITEWITERAKRNSLTDRLFTSKKNVPLTYSGIRHLFDAISKQIGIECLTSQTLRHTFCKVLIELGYSIEEVAKLAGHSDLSITRRYEEELKN